ncbi:hypothetical protein VCRA2119O145_60147 [Vibrio crassostreae]|uniref:Uncharacterized protein n=1 Tax=Vibrio crassostreae TaxID=246167 RepID=A0A822MUY8_9VIBR|nr:hypothetical protein VCRA2119O145_60147 [Vibrio crassostreae]CAK2372976.1 hypothetical protein VCRA2117O142_40148 [Vibrio crassostreae]CAK3053402.1 hypothetical protein VCRA2119O146_50086 [Vibrio crassostreae]CAK3060514.1 hypothetical protein VCRA2134O163_50149 [Vibrio crassostreae]CAK3170024.1 hypothetical protein VCRA2120O150_60149 [Vibrio crassostreae]
MLLAYLASDLAKQFGRLNKSVTKFQLRKKERIGVPFLLSVY